MSKKFSPDKGLLQKIDALYPTPFHLYSEAEIRHRTQNLKASFGWNEGYREYYAVKACPTPGVIRIMQNEGCGVDCASLCELMLAEAMGFRGDEIIFSSNETPKGEFTYARKLGAVINIDDITMIDFLEKECGLPEQLCLRYNPGGDFRLNGSIMGKPGEAKYGMTRAQIFEAVRTCMRKGVKRFGLHAFLASNNTNVEYYPTIAAELMHLALDLTRETGCEIFMLDLSGGIGIPYEPDQAEVDIALVGRKVKEAYDRYLVANGIVNIKLCTELGRYMTGPAGVLVTKAVHEKHIYKDYIGVDACAADLMRPAMYGAYHHITVAGKEDRPSNKTYDVVGSLCENNDKFAVDRQLPEIEMGDYLVIHDAGAHGRSMGYNYNGRLRCAEVLLKENGETELIRRAETPKDYFATLDICKDIKLQ